MKDKEKIIIVTESILLILLFVYVVYLKVNVSHYSQYINQRLHNDYEGFLYSSLDQANANIKKAIKDKRISKDDFEILIAHYNQATLAVDRIQTISHYVQNDSNGEFTKKILDSINNVLGRAEGSFMSTDSSNFQIDSEWISTFTRMESFNESILKILKADRKYIDVRNKRWSLFLIQMDNVIEKKDYRFQVNPG